MPIGSAALQRDSKKLQIYRKHPLLATSEILHHKCVHNSGGVGKTENGPQAKEEGENTKEEKKRWQGRRREGSRHSRKKKKQ